MSKSYRIRTTPGVDKSLNVLIDQEFEYLEILSLKLLQSDIYTRQCSDYGVVVGRVSVNNGFGIPNAKVSIFIPLETQDEVNPVISELYPYRTLIDTNEDGYRYNLLPYTKSHTGHKPTGTFFDRDDVLTNPTLIEVFDKYYKYTATTNESGDYMIFGVPIGSQTIVMDVDLSDIGEFSLSPQDLIRAGVATESQVSGTEFKTSTNLRELPQIININKTIEVEPLWGQPEICNLGITRTDFDLTSESNIEITPTAIFMGSIISTPNSHSVKRNCKPKGRGGYLCGLTVNSGEILAIRQTIFQDENGRPVLETFDLEQGGQVIDENGTWLVDVPMNLDFVTTNEFGEQVMSDDPKVGIPTKAKYRFKVKWNQSPSLSESTKRGYFLVPNIKEYGWDGNGNSIVNTEELYRSYTFSLDWSDYGNIGTTTGQHMIQEAIDCDDKFYFMQYNKVYTVSQFIDGFRRGGGLERYIGIKNILDNECESENNRFPTNDGNLRFDIIYILFTFLSIILTPVFFALIILLHLLYFTIWVLRVALIPLLIGWTVVKIINYSILIAGTVPYALGLIIGYLAMIVLYVAIGIALGLLLDQLWKMKLRGISVPLLTYPDCEMCKCSQGLPPEENPDDGEYSSESLTEDELPICEYVVVDETPVNQLYLSTSILKLSTNSPFKYTTPNETTLSVYNSSVKNGLVTQLIGLQYNGSDSVNPDGILTPSPEEIVYPSNDGEEAVYRWYHTLSLPIADRINLFNTKAKYFNQTSSNPGGGVNRIKVKFNPTIEPNKFHYDNTIVLLCDKSTLSRFTQGQMVSFQNPSYSKDINVNGGVDNIFGNNAITGDTLSNSNNLLTNVNVNYANPDGSGNQTITYNNVSQTPDDTNVVNFYKFPTDIEYFQVITGMTYSEFSGKCSTELNNSLNERYLNNESRVYNTEYIDPPFSNNHSDTFIAENGIFNVNPMDNIRNSSENCILILSRGVDPYSLPTTIEYGLGKLFGFNDEDSIKITGNFRLNIPVQGSYKNISHGSVDYSSQSNIGTDNYSNQKLYYNSYLFKPDTTQYSGFTSNLISYYSSLDNNSTNFKPICGDPTPPSVSSFANFNNSVGLNVKGTNPFTKEWGIVNIDFFTYTKPVLGNLTSNNVSNLNRGYFPNEIVEGASLLGLEYGSFGFGNFYRINFETTKPYFYSPIYNTTGNTLNYSLGSNDNQIVMRGDRLPISTVPTEYCCNVAPLQKNSSLSMYLIPNEGVIGVTSTIGDTNSGSSFEFEDFNEDTENVGRINSVIESFNCEGSAPLECYDGRSGNMIVKGPNDSCRRSGGKVIFRNGCYIFITRVFLSLPKDIEMLPEWISRNMISLGACRNVFSHRFNNNWINGTLYAFPFANDVIFTSPTSSNPNQPISRYCNRNVILHPTNNFYYRSSPYYYDDINDSNSRFVPGGGIKYPTTMMDLGPRNNFIQELVMSDDYDGYVVNKLDTSTYGDVDEILNLFIISRLINQGFLSNVLGSLNILGYFSRNKTSFDGDYSQLISINSELGVAPFQAANYPDNPPGYQNPIYFNNADNRYTVIGIFFSSDTQTRDYISPKRQILNPFTNSIDECSFNNINVFSQEVPMYQWNIKENNQAGITIFGWQENDWEKGVLDDGLFSFKYQDLDRLNPNSRYFRTNGSSATYFDKGHIYSVSGDTIGLDIDESVQYWDLNSGNGKESWITVGAPFHFYFGLKRGASAFDRFRRKWINTEIIVN
jgi:hypothetical protein